MRKSCRDTETSGERSWSLQMNVSRKIRLRGLEKKELWSERMMLVNMRQDEAERDRSLN